MTPQTLEQLRGCDVAEDKFLKLEYFFYTNADEKAEALSSELLEMGYSSEFGVSASDKKIRVVTGWTTPLIMAADSVIEWTGAMCSLGYRHDSDFDGWGTNPDQ